MIDFCFWWRRLLAGICVKPAADLVVQGHVLTELVASKVQSTPEPAWVVYTIYIPSVVSEGRHTWDRFWANKDDEPLDLAGLQTRGRHKTFDILGFAKQLCPWGKKGCRFEEHRTQLSHSNINVRAHIL